MTKYEITFLFKKNEKQPQKIAEAVFKTTGVKVIKTHDWKVKELTHPIGKQSEAYFLHFETETEGKKLAALREKINLEEKILHHLIVKKK